MWNKSKCAGWFFSSFQQVPCCSEGERRWFNSVVGVCATDRLRDRNLQTDTYRDKMCIQTKKKKKDINKLKKYHQPVPSHPRQSSIYTTWLFTMDPICIIHFKQFELCWLVLVLPRLRQRRTLFKALWLQDLFSNTTEEGTWRKDRQTDRQSLDTLYLIITHYMFILSAVIIVLLHLIVSTSRNNNNNNN